jgi:hypothetical protein
MAETGHYLAVFYSDKSGPQWQEWLGLSAEERAARDAVGLAALAEWDAAQRDLIVYDGGPLGPTKRVTADGIADTVNQLTVFLVVRAPSHAAAAAMFENHPHCTIFPCHSVEVMPLLGP